MRPLILEKLLTQLQKLPTITKKQAEKMAYLIIDNHQKEAQELIPILQKALTDLKHCQICNHISDGPKCNICQDQKRRKTLIIVESSSDVFKFETMSQMRPYYHVLGSLIKVNAKDSLAQLNLQNLKTRAANFQEIIIALSPNLAGIVTANYLKALLKDYKVTQLAQGIPLGAAMEYVDELTLKAALENRKEVK